MLGSSQGSAVVLALAPAPTPAPTLPSMFPSSSNGPVMGVGGGAPTPAVVAGDDNATVVDTDDSDTGSSVVGDTTDNSEASTTDETASTTPDTGDDTPPPPPAPALPTGAPVVDSFDSYSDSLATSAWSVWPTANNTIILFKADTGTADYANTDPSITNDCHSGSCIMSAGSAGGLGTFGYASSMYKESGVGQDSGAFTIWARARMGWRKTSINIGLCEGEFSGCGGPTLYWVTNDAGPDDNVWHEYYIAWRQGSTNVETCLLMDDTNAGDCVWKPITDTDNFPPGTQFDGVQLQASVLRPDLGDQVWFDDLANAPQ